MTALDTIKTAILGNPVDPKKKPSRTGVVKAFAEMQTQLEGAQAGALVFDTYAALTAVAAVPSANIMAWVMTGVQAGIYQNTGSALSPVWTRRGSIPQFLVTGINVGAGTANAIQITTDIPMPSQDGRALLVVPVLATNTASPPTVSIDGGTPLPIVTNTGNNVVIGGITAGMYIVGFVSAGKFRLLSDQASASIVAAAEEILEQIIALGQPFVMVENYGYIPGQDATAAFQAAHDALPTTGGVIVLSGRPYKINSQVVFTKSVGIIGNGSFIDLSGFSPSSSDSAFLWQGNGPTAVTTTITAAIVSKIDGWPSTASPQTQRAITVANSAAFANGDVCAITSTEYAIGITGQSGFGPRTKGEFNIIREKVSSTSVFMEDYPLDEYSVSGQTVTLTKMDMLKGVFIRGVRSYGTGRGNQHTSDANSAVGPRLATFRFCIDPIASDLDLENFPRYAIDFDRCYGFTVANSNFKGRDLKDPTNTGSPMTAGVQSQWFTAIHSNSVQNIVITGNRFARHRRPLDCSYLGIDGTSDSKGIITRNTSFVGNTVEDCENGFGSHWSETITITGNTIVGCNVGIASRSKFLVISGNSIRRCDWGMYHTPTSRSEYLTMTITENSYIQNIVITGNVFDGMQEIGEFGGSIVGFVFTGNDCRNIGGNCLVFNCKQLRATNIANNNFDMTGNVGNRFVVNYPYVSAATLSFKEFKFTNNQVIGGYGAIFLGGGTSGNRATSIDISNNSFIEMQNAGSIIALGVSFAGSPSYIFTEVGYFGASVRIIDNYVTKETTYSGTFVNYNSNFSAPPQIFGNTVPNAYVEPSTWPKFSAHRSVDQTSITSATNTKVNFNVADINTGSYFNVSTAEFTPPAGDYLVSSTVYISAGIAAAGDNYQIQIRKNGTLIKSKVYRAPSTSGFSIEISEMITLNGTDAVTIWVNFAGTGDKTIAALVGVGYASDFNAVKLL